MDSELESIIMELIVGSGSARSYAMEAISLAKEGKFADAHKALEDAEEEMSKAHGGQTSLIQKAAKGESVEINLFMVHAQDHVMTAMLARDLAKEIVALHEGLAAKSKTTRSSSAKTSTSKAKTSTAKKTKK